MAGFEVSTEGLTLEAVTRIMSDLRNHKKIRWAARRSVHRLTRPVLTNAGRLITRKKRMAPEDSIHCGPWHFVPHLLSVVPDETVSRVGEKLVEMARLGTGCACVVGALLFTLSHGIARDLAEGEVYQKLVRLIGRGGKSDGDAWGTGPANDNGSPPCGRSGWTADAGMSKARGDLPPGLDLAVRRSVMKLPPDDQRLIRAIFLQDRGVTYREIAGEMALTAAAFRKRLSRIRKALREMLIRELPLGTLRRLRLA